MTAFAAALGAAVVLAFVVNESVRAREEQLWRRDQEQRMAELAFRRDWCEQQMVAQVVAGCEALTARAAELEAEWLLPCAADREVSR